MSLDHHMLLGRLLNEAIDTHTPTELAMGFLRYEALRKADVMVFGKGDDHAAGKRFDDIVTEALLKWKSKP